MGYYIQTNANSGKAQWLRFNMGGDLAMPAGCPTPPVWEDTPEGRALVCVIDNGEFEAAGLCFSKKEMEEFGDPRDQRPKTWVYVDKVMAYEDAGYTPRVTGVRFGGDEHREPAASVDHGVRGQQTRE